MALQPIETVATNELAIRADAPRTDLQSFRERAVAAA